MFAFKAGASAFALAVALATAGAAHANETDENSRNIAAALAAKTTLAQAVTAAERQGGGHGFKIALRDHDGSYAYKVKLIASDGKVSEVSVDPATGKVLRSETEGFFSRLFGESDGEAAKVNSAPTTLSAAIGIAEKQATGKAIEARYKAEDNTQQYRVAVAKDQAVRDVTIDAVTGKVLKIGAAGSGEHHDGDGEED